MTQYNKAPIPKKRVNLENTIIYKSIQIRNLRLFLTAVVLLCVGLATLFPIILVRNYFFMVVMGLIVSISIISISIYQFILVYRRNEDAFNHPDMNRFLKWGEDYGTCAFTMDEELKENKRTDISGTYFTRNFVIIPSFYRYRWFQFSEVCWAFIRVTKHSINFIPTGTTHEVNVFLDNRDVVTIESNKSEDLLHHLIRKAPFALYGYSAQIKEAWSTDTSNFISIVKQRKNQFLADPDRYMKEHSE